MVIYNNRSNLSRGGLRFPYIHCSCKSLFIQLMAFLTYQTLHDTHWNFPQKKKLWKFLLLPLRVTNQTQINLKSLETNHWKATGTRICSFNCRNKQNFLWINYLNQNWKCLTNQMHSFPQTLTNTSIQLQPHR